MRESVRATVEQLLGASPALNERDFIACLKREHGIPEEATLAVIEDLIDEGKISRHGNSISLENDEAHLVDWSFELFGLHFHLMVGKTRNKIG